MKRRLYHGWVKVAKFRLWKHINRFVITGRNEVVAKVIFLHLSVILFTGGGVSASVHAGMPSPKSSNPWSRHLPEQTPPKSRHPPEAHTPWEQTPLLEQTPPPQKQTIPQEQTPRPGADTPQKQTPPGADTPQEADPLGSRQPPRSRHPLEADTPQSRHPPQEADSGIWSMSGQYASYWNAFLFTIMLTQIFLCLFLGPVYFLQI